MSKRSSWCEFGKETRKYIKNRDQNRCILCGSTNNLQIMHIFVNRSHGGKGSKENGCLGCYRCHIILDNPIGAKMNELSKKYKERLKTYLIVKENIEYNKDFIESLRYKK